ncbi:MAG: ethanolamine utilization protein, partial [Steroidobacteraceae bacterium]
SATRDDRSNRLAELVRRIEWDETAGELGALLLEARLIRESKPLYNRALKGAPRVWTIVVGDDGAAPRIAPLGEVQLSFEPCDLFGSYRSERAARAALVALAREHRLCLKALGLEAAEGSCFAYQLGRCDGVCVRRESLARHTARVKLALADTHLKPWPFPGAIGIRERNAAGFEQLHVVDAWQHLATVDADESSEVALERALCRNRAPFDLDAYRIIFRYITRARQPRLVTLASPASATLSPLCGERVG